MRAHLAVLFSIALAACAREDSAERPGPKPPVPQTSRAAEPAVPPPLPVVPDDSSADAGTPADAGPAAQADGGEVDADGGVAPFPEVEGDPARFPLHAIATSLNTSVYPEARNTGNPAGYLRMGARLRVGPTIRGGGCPDGWHELPSGGFVCERDGLFVSSSTILRPGAPPAPCLTCPLPYEYGFTRLPGTPMLTRLPDPDETRIIDEMTAERERPPTAPAQPAPAPATSDGGVAAAVPAVAAPAVAAPPAAAVPAVAAPAVAAPPAAVSAPAEPSDQHEPPTAAEERRAPSVLTWLERGFFVSINRLIGARNRRLYFKTIYGRYVPESRVFRFAGFSPFQGVHLDATRTLPLYFVKSTRAFLEPAPETPGAQRVRVDRLTLLDVAGREGRNYRLVTGQRIERGLVAKVDVVPPPPDLAAGEKWIDVDLSEQTLVAYEGERPVLATMVSTGKEGFDTPRGDYRIRSKHVATTMDGNTATDGPYSIEDVPWTMYFHRSYALHGAFWHRQYGIARSHGCVNLSPNDARFLFSWTDPPLPAGWHGVFTTRDHRGTRVIVHD